MVEISKLKKFGPDCESFHQNRCTLIWWKNSTLGSVVPLATSYFFLDCSGVEACCQIPEQEIWIKGCKWDEKKNSLVKFWNLNCAKESFWFCLFSQLKLFKLSQWRVLFQTKIWEKLMKKVRSIMFLRWRPTEKSCIYYFRTKW